MKTANTDMNISQALPSHAGVFFIEEGVLFPFEESWKIIIYRDLKPLFIGQESLTRLAGRFHAMSLKYHHFPNTRQTTSFIDVNLAKIEQRLSEINMYLGENTRTRRELIDGLSTILKWLIGTPDAKDAKRYDEYIALLEKRELDLTSLMQKQLQITSSTIKNFNETIFAISYDEQIINENINRLDTYLNSSTKLVFDIKASEEISTLSLQILELVINLENDINDCLTSILFAKSGTMHPSVISLKKLYQELLVSNHARTGKRLIVPVTLNNIHTLLESATLSAYVYSNKLIYTLEFPLIQTDKFILYHLYSVPIQHLNSSYFTTIIPEHIYLAAKPDGQQYVSMSSLEKCKSFAPARKTCKGVIIYDSSARPLCELQILYSSSTTIPKICTTTTFPAKINTFQQLAGNKWIYILSDEAQCILQCEKEVSHHKLQGAGIITIPMNCKLHTGYSTLSAFRTTEENVTYPIIIPDIRTENCCEDIKEFKNPKLIPIPINDLPLDSLSRIKHHIDEFHKELQELKSTPFTQRHQPLFSWTYLTMGVIILLYTILKCCNINPVKILRRRRRTSEHQNRCIQIFNNCFESSNERQAVRIAIPMHDIERPINNAHISEDEDEATTEQQPSNKDASSLF